MKRMLLWAVTAAVVAGIALAAPRSSPPRPSPPPPPPVSEDPVQRLIDTGLAGDGAYRKLAWLTDRIGPRLSGSEKLEKAVAWCTAEMKRDRSTKCGPRRSWSLTGNVARSPERSSRRSSTR
jgi:hypothetical protein